MMKGTHIIRKFVMKDTQIEMEDPQIMMGEKTEIEF